MAFRDQLPGTIDLPKFFNVDQAVGPKPRGSNRRTDVMLVQFFLKKLYNKGSTLHPPLRPPAGPQTDVDGKFGPITRKWIKHFQAQASKRLPTKQDGIVDPALGGQATGSVSHTIYTIVTMNLLFKQLDPANFDFWFTAPDVPPELQNEIFLRLRREQLDEDF